MDRKTELKSNVLRPSYGRVVPAPPGICVSSMGTVEVGVYCRLMSETMLCLRYIMINTGCCIKGIINQETLIKELSKALCRICEAVRHVQLKLLLYPVKEMQELVGRLYANLIKFAVRAIKWYREPRILHALSAIARPYPLRFKDIVEDIHDTIRQIDRLALSMSQAEQRQILLKLDETRAASQDVQRMVRLELEATRKELEASRLMLAELNMAISSESSPRLKPSNTARHLSFNCRNESIPLQRLNQY